MGNMMVYVRKPDETDEQARERWHRNLDRELKLQKSLEKARLRRDFWRRLWWLFWKIAAKIFWIVATGVIVWFIERHLSQQVN